MYCTGRTQSCFLTILRIPAASLTRLAPHLHPPEPCTLDSIPHSGTLPTHMCIPLYMHRFITSTHRTLAHARHATTSIYAITPTAIAYAPNNLHPGGHTRHIRTEHQLQCSAPCIYNTHTAIMHTHTICIYTSGAVYHRAQCASRAPRAICSSASQYTIPRCRIRTAAQSGSWAKVVRTLTVFFSVFLIHRWS